MTRKVLLDPRFRSIREILTPEDEVHLRSMAEIIWGKDEPATEEIVAAHKDEIFAIITGRWAYGDVAQFPQLRAILEVGGRLPSPKQLDYQYCFGHNIRVLSCAPAFGPMVAEMALGMALACTREIVDGHNAMHDAREKWLWDGNVGTYTLFDQTIGLIGYGGLARALQPLLAPFRPRLLVYDPWLPNTYIEGRGAEPVPLATLLSSSKVIFVLAIPSLENAQMLDRAMLAQISPGSVLVLMSRAAVVDFDALTELVLANRFKAAIDVFPQEPLPNDHPIRRAPNVVLSAHRAGSVERDLRLIGRLAVQDLEAILAGLPPHAMQIAQPELIYRLP